MTSDHVVEALDVVEHICLGLVPGSIGFAGRALGLQRREEALHGCTVPYISRSAHAANDAAVGHQSLELLAAILAALIGVMQQLPWLAALPDCHQQGICDQLRRHSLRYVQPQQVRVLRAWAPLQ